MQRLWRMWKLFGVGVWTVVLGWLLFGSVASNIDSYEPRDGDLIFQMETGGPSHLIQLATASPFNHVGVVIRAENGPQVFEALGRVSATKFSDYVNRKSSLAKRYRVMRLKDHPNGLNRSETARVRAQAHRFLGKPYDSGLSWSDQALNCSELVWKTYERALGVELCTPERLEDNVLTSQTGMRLAEDALKAKGQTQLARAVEKIDLSQLYVSPADLSRSEALTTVWTNLPMESLYHRPAVTVAALVVTFMGLLVRRLRRRRQAVLVS